MSRCPEEFVSFADRLADAAGQIQRRHYRQSVAVEIKPDGSPVTQVDRETERVLRDLIEQNYPHHGISGEEYPDVRTHAEYIWVLDPLDGTKSFLAGMPLFGILIGLAQRRRFVLGVMDQPILRDRWIGADGHGARLNGEAATTRPCRAISEAVVSTSGPGDYARAVDPALARVREGARWLRFGADCVNYGLVATGLMDVVADAGLDTHDFAALEAVVRNAGGTFTDWDGAPITLGSDGRVLAAGDRAVHAEALARLQKS